MPGLYIHTPFCLKKCPYCDFFSVPYDERMAFAYAEAVIRNIEHYNDRYDTVYFGGGTPSMDWWNICRVLGKILSSRNAEITVESNPNTLNKESLSVMKNSGINRLSIGVQSFSNSELRALSRGHTSEDASNAIRLALESGFENVSVDLMLGIPTQTPESVRRSVKILSAFGITHVSAYMLKREPGTPFAKSELRFPDENLTAQIYFAAAEALEENGFLQYEISNFARKGFVSRHNLKYWKSEEYLGIGVSAHSFYDNRRFFVGNNIREFIISPAQEVFLTEEGPPDFTDYAMMKLRLVEGLTFAECEKFGIKKDAMMKRCKLVPPDYLRITDRGVVITREGFLVSNQIIGKLTTNPEEQVVK